MAEEPKVRGGLCLNVDGEGCKKFTLRDIAREKAKAPIENGPKSVLVLGCSGGYGLASRIAVAFGGPKAETLGVSFERAPTERKAGSPGWYNNEAFDEVAKAEGLKAITISADAFADATRETVAQLAKENGFKPFDLVDISTENDSFYCYTSKKDVITKLAFATEEIYRINLEKKRGNRK